MNIFTFKQEEDFIQTGASLIVSLIQGNPKAILGLATGSSPLGVYARLADMYTKGLVSFTEASSYNLDEYVGLPGEHPQSYNSFMKQHLFNHIDIDSTRTHIPNGHADDLQAECQSYDLMLEQNGPVDLQLLGIGSNGHIGFNEPDDNLSGGTHVVDLLEETIEANARFFTSLDEVPKQAITMGVGSIMKARQIVLLARGTDKAEAVKAALQGPITTECPASLLQCHPNVIVLLDEEAGRLLS
ncbi:glucosamine-6-phosphate deaminase [Paenibacillus crassostreae]|uniref:Glucosamine-6-phosphate deaminase n=1 Tax=Paenibacillus crassostreae TaxID=1763538 RepID=A0A162KPP0_9BACL|nr:glucosamine-6-phosphate deaminase [Paenibacillus crassostreae]AOZ93039.1 glucosamine-6-phosphate deaminase [Paenibacillus crassostreae]OAB71873.1 glucosamine-6-phosphate deaminase [Paenibacillus crassostreae]